MPEGKLVGAVGSELWGSASVTNREGVRLHCSFRFNGQGGLLAEVTGKLPPERH